MSLLLGALTIGVLLSLLGISVFISFRVFNFPDLTCEGSFTLGAAVAAMLIIGGSSPLTATLAAVLAGALAGTVTGITHTRFKINDLLAGILVMTALYSINLRVMGGSNLSLSNSHTFPNAAAHLGLTLAGGADSVLLLGWKVPVHDLSILLASVLMVALLVLVLLAFFGTHIGLAMRATGDNSQMIRALGVNDGSMKTLGLALSNAVAALSGALLAQYQGFADVQMGIGMIVTGLASVILGEALTGSRRLSHLVIGTLLGSMLFRLLVAVALRMGLEPNDLKLITAAFVLIALVSPTVIGKLRGPRATGVGHA
jgi:putative ABC transport system permease protein